MYCTVRLVDYIKLKNTHFGITDSSSMAFPAWIIQAGIVLAVCVVLGFAVHWMALRRAPQAPRNSGPQSASQICLKQRGKIRLLSPLTRLKRRGRTRLPLSPKCR